MSDLLKHVQEHTSAAQVELHAALRMMKEDPQPGLTTWWGFLAQKW